MSFELEHTDISPESRVDRFGVVLAREMFNRNAIEKRAQELIENSEDIKNSEIENEIYNNAATGLFEKITAAGHLSHIEFEGDQEEIHEATIKRLLNGRLENTPDWENHRNFAEICEELTVYETFKKIKTGELPADTMIVTHSNLPDENVDEEEKIHVGYRTLNAKGMLRTYSFNQNENGEWVRILEQVSRSNSDDNSTRDWFNSHASAVPITSTGALSEQVIVSSKRLPNGVVSLVEELDGPDRLYGESEAELIENNRPDYSVLREVSAERENTLGVYINEINQYDTELKQKQEIGEISYAVRLNKFDKKINEINMRILLLAPQYTKDTYGKASVQNIEAASIAFYQGDHLLAQRELEQGHRVRNKKASVGCGGSGKADSDSDFDIDSKINPFEQAVEKASEDKEDWKWSKGVCQVKSCSSRPGQTEVGPCSVCKNCQKKFDAGEDPTKEADYTPSEGREKSGGLMVFLSNVTVEGKNLKKAA